MESEEHSNHEEDDKTDQEGISRRKIENQECLDLASKIKFFFMRVENDCFETSEDSRL